MTAPTSDECLRADRRCRRCQRRIGLEQVRMYDGLRVSSPEATDGATRHRRPADGPRVCAICLWATLQAIEAMP